MRLKVLLIFLAFQLSAFGLYAGVHAFWPSFEQNIIAKTDQTLKPASFRLSAEGKTTKIPGETSNLIYETIRKLPANHTKSLQKIVLEYNPEASRGMGGARTIILKSYNVSVEELNAVLIHEIGHTTDLGSLQAETNSAPSEFKDGTLPIYQGDPSLDFYRISWDNEKQIKSVANNFDFVSGYAMTDPFEDFAETYLFYILHDDEFRFLASQNDALLAKYNFMKNTVFAGREYAAAHAATTDWNAFLRVWDVTLLPYSGF